MTQSKDLAKSIFLTIGVSAVMVVIAYGILYLMEFGSPIKYSVTTVTAAVFFILGTIYLDRRGGSELPLIAGGLVLSMISVFFTIVLVGGIFLLYMGYVSDSFKDLMPSLDVLLSSFAVGLIISFVMLQIFFQPFMSRNSQPPHKWQS